MRHWLPNGFEEAVTYDWFQNEFDVDEMVVISWEGCQLDDPRVSTLREALEKAENAEAKDVDATATKDAKKDTARITQGLGQPSTKVCAAP